MLDLFSSHVAGAPLLIFIHGEYWQANDKINYGFIADPVVSLACQYQLWLGAGIRHG